MELAQPLHSRRAMGVLARLTRSVVSGHLPTASLLGSSLLFAVACGPSEETHLSTGVSYDLYPTGLLLPGTTVEATFSYYEYLVTCADGGGLQSHPECTHESGSVDAVVESATCNSPGCTVTKTAVNRISITSDHSGTVVVDVVARGEGQTESFTKQVVLDFSEVTRIDVFHDCSESLGATLPVIQGTKLEWCATAYGTAQGRESPMHIMAPNESEPARIAVDGTILTQNGLGSRDEDGSLGCLGFTASQTGTGWFEASYGDSTRRIPLRVVDPTQVVGLTMNDVLPVQTNPQSYLASVDTPTLVPCAKSSLQLATFCTAGANIFAIEFRLDDGTTASGFWRNWASDTTGDFVFTRAFIPPYSGYPGDADRHVGVFSFQGIANGSGTWLLAAGTDDTGLVLPKFSLPVTVAIETDYCTACAQ